MNIIDKMEDNNHHNDCNDDAASIDSDDGDDISQDGKDKGGSSFDG